MGEENVTIDFKFATVQGEYAIFVEAVGLGPAGENVYIGQLSETYKDLVRPF